MRKIITLLLFVCMLSTSVPIALAGGVDETPPIINNYEQLIEWKNAGCPNTLTIGIVPLGDFGWPTEEIVIDFASSSAISVPLRSSSWTIPENVTIKNLSLSVTEKATLNVYGKILNSQYVTGATTINNVTVYESTVNLGANAEVYGGIYLKNGSSLVSNDAYVEIVEVHDYSGSTGMSANISGTLKTDLINLSPNMTANIMENSIIDTESIRGNEKGNIVINRGAELYYRKYSYLSMRITVKSGGKLYSLFQHLTPENVITIEEGGVVNSYFGILTGSNYPNGAIRGSGTINLYGNMYGFRYDDGTTKEYWTNPNVETPGTVPCLDATIVINKIKKCDHAGGMTYRYLSYIPSGETEPTMHFFGCSTCGYRVEGTEAPHTYELEGTYETFSRYRCICGRSYEVARLTGTCGTDINFLLTEGTLTLEGSGESSDFSAEDAPWISEAENITEIEIGDNVTGIGANAFEGCTALETVSVSSDVKKIDASAFAFCDSLEKVEYDGTYEQWKEIDVKEGNNAFLYAEVVFNDNSKLLAPANEYCGKTDVLFKTFESQGTTSLELCIISDENKITQEELKDAVVYVAVYDENGKMEKLESLTKSKEESRVEFSGNMPTENNFQILIWSRTCFPMTNSVTGN